MFSHPDADIRINMPEVDPKHAVVELRADGTVRARSTLRFLERVTHSLISLT